MQCRENCGACCIAPSILQALPNMPAGKAAGQPCANLDMSTKQCRIWGSDDYPTFCQGFTPEREFCGDSTSQGLQILTVLEAETAAK